MQSRPCAGFFDAMKRADFHFDLPQELIAQHPLADRTASRLLHLDAGANTVSHRLFKDLPDLLTDDDLLVFNNTRVIPARLWGRKASGGKLEILIERLTGENTAVAHIRASKSPKAGTELVLSAEADGPPGSHRLTVTGREGALFRLETLGGENFATVLSDIGHMPLPPYIERTDTAVDRERYQTVYASREGAVAAPTAGLHFDESLLETLADKGVRRAEVTLHVGAGTFQPVRVDDVAQHQMHSEYLEVDQSVCDAVAETRERGGRVVAVGTTAVRSLETASQSGSIAPYRGDTDIFIYPGYRFRSVDAMITNFHLPESTLLMLVSAFAGRDAILAAYREAIAQRYRFFSYGDAMLLTSPVGGTDA